MAETITTKDLKTGLTFIKKGRGHGRIRFVIRTVHRDGTLTYAPEMQLTSMRAAVRIPTDEFLRDVFGSRVPTRKEISEQYQREQAEREERIGRTKDAEFTAILMNFLMDARAGEDINDLTERLRLFVEEEKDIARDHGYDDGYETRKVEEGYLALYR